MFHLINYNPVSIMDYIADTNTQWADALVGHLGYCGKMNPSTSGPSGIGYVCTKPTGHTGHHAAVEHDHLPNAVWANLDETPERRKYRFIFIDGRKYRPADFRFQHDSTPTAWLLRVTHVAEDLTIVSSRREASEAVYMWLTDVGITETQYAQVEGFIRRFDSTLRSTSSMHPAKEQELARLRTENAALRRDNDLATRLYEKSKHSIKEAERAREILDTVAAQRSELQGRLAAAKLELAEQKRRTADAGRTIANLHRDLTLVIAKGRRRKAAIRKLEAAHAHLGVLLTGEQRRNAHQYRIFLDAAGDAHRLRREVADRDRIIDEYHDAATGTTSRVCPDRNPETGAPCLRAWGHEPFHHRSAARETTGVLWEYWATVPAVPRNPL